ncbi:MAG: sugar phosphate nucleotidyltransferase [Oscillospiraceae bacterium]
MKKPVLVIMAAGMGSRFGGPKQITPVDPQGHIIIDFSLYDAWRAGFRDVAFIIKRETEAEFRQCIGDRMEKYFHVSYVYQDNDRLPEGFSVPEGRTKPWGTGHAVACCRGVVDGPFAVINADDFYGRTAFSAIYDFLSGDPARGSYAMVGYRLRNTVTEHGSVARGVCEIEDGLLRGITERTNIIKQGADAAFSEDGGKTYTSLPGETIVSMNMWGFSAGLLDELWDRFPAFLEKNLPVNPVKCEYFLPFVVNEQLSDGSATVRVLPCEESWYGVTYREDLESVCSAIARMKAQGIYEEELWK